MDPSVQLLKVIVMFILAVQTLGLRASIAALEAKLGL
jgi:hypothetical protein